MHRAVPASSDFARIAALPRRQIRAEDARAWAALLTQEYARHAGARLRPWQGLALAEAALHDGAFLALPVGIGKTLVAELLPALLHARSAVLIVPAALREKTFGDRAALRRDWHLPATPPLVLSREELSGAAQADRLATIAPDLIIVDEADDLANPASSVARRIDRYVRSRRDAVPTAERRRVVRTVCLTGTPARKSLLGYWHLLVWNLDHGAPVPLTRAEAETWAQALDERPGSRPSPGPMGRTLSEARAWFRARLVETPGVVVIDEDSAGSVPLTIRQRLAREDAVLDEGFRRLLVEQENPAGIPITDDSERNPLSLSRLDGQTGCGLVTYWDPPPPPEWRAARRDFARFVRERIESTARARRPLDTEAQVVKACPDAPQVVRWLAVRGTFEPHTRVRWMTDATVLSAIDWLAESHEPGIVWTGSVPFGQALAKRARLSYYGQLGQDQHGRSLCAAPHDRSLVASWNANKKGFNLQPWARALVVMPPPSAKWLEQIFGRLHRAGQTRPVVIDVLLTSGGTADAFEAALREARYVRTTTSQSQKILRARIERVTPQITASNRFRWARKQKGPSND